MHRVLVADDEEVIRTGIASLVQWQSIDCELVGTAANGEEAYRVLVERKPDIVITDIKMPVVDGLELIARAAAEKIPASFIILSGYDEFELARRAMQFGVRHYLLKPTDENELSAVVREVCGELDGRDAPETHPSDSSSITRLVEYVTLHLDQTGMSLQWLAAHVVYFNVDYLGRLFKRERGESFSQFLLRCRLDAACRMLREAPAMKIAEVAARVGFGPNAQYFSQLFKRCTGLTPREFREGPPEP